MQIKSEFSRLIKKRVKSSWLNHSVWISDWLRISFRIFFCAFLFKKKFTIFFPTVIIKNIISKLIRIWRKHWAWIRNCCFHHMLPLVWMDIWWALAELNSTWTRPVHWAWPPLKKTMCGTTLRRMKVAHCTADAFVIYIWSTKRCYKLLLHCTHWRRIRCNWFSKEKS